MELLGYIIVGVTVLATIIGITLAIVAGNKAGKVIADIITLHKK